jgi:o-succinylbenzoate synthase
MRIDAIILRELHMPLVRPFETSFGVTRNRRIVLAEVQSEGLSGWGECTAGERPFFSGESTDSAWQVLVQELAPMLAAESPEHGGDCPGIFRAVRGNPMAKAALENAIWDLEAQREGVSLSRLLGGVRDSISAASPSGFSPRFMNCLQSSSASWPTAISASSSSANRAGMWMSLSAVRSRWPGILLSCDANSAYRLRDQDHIASFDAFDLLMIEQPLWHDDFYFHSVLQKRINTPICLDESIRNRRDALAAIEMESCKIINVKLGRVGGFSEAIAVHNAAHGAGHSRLVRRHARVRHGPRAQHRALHARRIHAARRCFRLGALLCRRHH